jgi:hypothetical protein
VYVEIASYQELPGADMARIFGDIFVKVVWNAVWSAAVLGAAKPDLAVVVGGCD